MQEPETGRITVRSRLGLFLAYWWHRRTTILCRAYRAQLPSFAQLPHRGARRISSLQVRLRLHWLLLSFNSFLYSHVACLATTAWMGPEDIRPSGSSWSASASPFLVSSVLPVTTSMGANSTGNRSYGQNISARP